MQNLSISGFAATETHHFDEFNVQTEFIMCKQPVQAHHSPKKNTRGVFAILRGHDTRLTLMGCHFQYSHLLEFLCIELFGSSNKMEGYPDNRPKVEEIL